MVVRKLLTNNNIYNYADNLLNSFKSMSDKSLPVKVHFYLQKNMDELVEIARSIEQSRYELFNKYGTLNTETGKYEFDTDKIELINKELRELFNLEQEVKIYMIPMKWVEDIELTATQVNAISFMLDLDEEEEE